MTDQSSTSNRILASLSQGELRRLTRQLRPVTVKLGQILYEPAVKIHQVYFPVDCLLSLLTAVDRRRTLEVGMVGNEGMAGLPIILGSEFSAVRVIVQGAGQALCMAAATFKKEFARTPDLQQAVHRYINILMAQISQTAACNRFHGSEQRLARWLLMTSDRVGSESFPLTQEFLAHMLGLRREGVTLAASALKRRGLIAYSRGQLQIPNRSRLIRACCYCYQAVANPLSADAD